MIWSRPLAGLFLGLTLLSLASCSGVPREDGFFDILALRGPSSIGMVHLIDSPGVVNGRPLRIRMMDEPMQARAVILKEQPDLAVLPLNMAAILYNKGLPYQVAAIPVWGTLYLCGTDTAIRSWSDLKGRKINLMGRGATPDIVTRYFLGLEGLDPDKDLVIDYAFPSPADLANAMIAGIVQVAVLSEPMLSLAQARNQEIRVILDFSSEWASKHPDAPGMPQTAILVHRRMIREHPDDYREVLERWRRSTESVKGNPLAVADQVVRHKILPDRATAILSIPRSNLAFVPAREAKSAINRYLSVLLKFSPDAIGRQMPDEGFIYQEPVH
ncbi:MAG: ABC transporter substrate-binding protein [Bacteroidales bacterium]